MRIAGLVIIVAGYLLIRVAGLAVYLQAACLGLMGVGLLLLLVTPSHPAADKEKAAPGLITEPRLRYVCLALVIAGIAALSRSAEFFSAQTLVSIVTVLAAMLAYFAGRAAISGSAKGLNAALILIGLGSFCAMILSSVILLFSFAEASSAPEMWRMYSYVSGISLAASVYGVYYAFSYRVDTELLRMLARSGFRMADTGPLSRDGRFDARGVWDGTEMLVNVDRYPGSSSRKATFSLEVSCELKNWSGHRLLVHPSNDVIRPVLAAISIPKVDGPDGWDAYSVYCDPPEAAVRLLSAIGGKKGLTGGIGAGLCWLFMDKGRLTLSVHRVGEPGERYIKNVMTRTASWAKAVS